MRGRRELQVTMLAFVDLERVEAAMALDKKAEGTTMRWVLLEGMGRAVVRSDVPQELARQALRELAG